MEFARLAFHVATIVVLAATVARADTCYDMQGIGDVSCSDQNDAKPSSRAMPAKPDTGMREELRRRMADAAKQAAAQAARETRVRSAQTRLDAIKERLSQPVAPEDRVTLRKNYEAAMREYRAAADAFIAGAPEGERVIRQQRRDGYIAELESSATAADLFAPVPQPVVAEAPPSVAEWPKKILCEPKDAKGIERCYEVDRRGLSCRLVLEQNGDRMWSQKQSPCSNTLALDLRNDLLRRSGDTAPIAVSRELPVAPPSDVDVGEALDTGIALVGALGDVLGGASALAGASRAGSAAASASTLTHATRTSGQGGTSAPASRGRASDISGTTR